MTIGRTAARLHGILGLGLGLVMLASTRSFARWIGVHPSEQEVTVIRAVGLRGLVTSAGLLLTGDTRWRAARIMGFLGDIGLLSMTASDAGLRRRLTRHPVDAARVRQVRTWLIGIVAIELGAALIRRGTAGRSGRRPIRVRQSITIHRPVEEVYRFWRDLENLPRFMRHLEAVEVADDRHSHWRAAGPAGTSVEWDARIEEDRPGERISWRSEEDAEVPNEGTVTFRPARRAEGTEVVVELEYRPPGGRVGAAVASLLGEEPSRQTRDDLRRLKDVLEHETDRGGADGDQGAGADAQPVGAAR